MRQVTLYLAVVVGLTSCGPEVSPTPYLITLTPSATVFQTLTLALPTVDHGATLLPLVTATISPTTLPVVPAPSATSHVPLPTDPPAPTSVPTAWPAALDVPGASKMGIHVVFNNDPRIMEFVRRVKPRVVKAVDSLGWLSDVKQASPLTITIGRFTNVPDQAVLDGKDSSQYPDPAEFARAFIAYFLNEYHLNPGVDYWEGWNEFPPNSPAQWVWYAQFEAHRACQPLRRLNAAMPFSPYTNIRLQQCRQASTAAFRMQCL